MSDGPTILTPFKMFNKAEYRQGNPSDELQPVVLREPGTLTHPSEMAAAEEPDLGGTANIGNVEPAEVDPLTGGLDPEALSKLTTNIGGVLYKISHLKKAGVNYNVTPEGELVTEARNPDKATVIQAALEAAFPPA